jgi:hypothetical protein
MKQHFGCKDSSPFKSYEKLESQMRIMMNVASALDFLRMAPWMYVNFMPRKSRFCSDVSMQRSTVGIDEI